MGRDTVIGLIGSGNMASAMVEGFVRAAPARANRILLTDRGSGRAARLAQRVGATVADSNAELVARSDIVMLCVKPVDIESVLRSVGHDIRSDTTVVSVAAGVTTVTIEAVLDEAVAVLRVMPNVPVQVCRGTVVVASGRFADTAAEAPVLDWMQLLGTVVQLDERYMDAATALSGSGPAFLALLVEAFEDAGIVAGLTHDKARQLILSTIDGTAALLAENDLSASSLRRMVTSPGGTAANGLAVLERAGVRGAIIDAVQTAMRRARELG